VSPKVSQVAARPDEEELRISVLGQLGELGRHTVKVMVGKDAASITPADGLWLRTMSSWLSGQLDTLFSFIKKPAASISGSAFVAAIPT
jgi:hypothetical protein